MEIINGVYDSNACIQLAYNGKVIYVNKAQIRSVDIVRADTVRLDLGLGALRNIYIRLNDVIYPGDLANVDMLQNYIMRLMSTNAVANENAEQIKAMIDALLASLQHNVGSFNSEPLREDESQPSIVYKGYAIPGAIGDQKVWAIVRITRRDSINISEWAEGNQTFDKVWDNRYNLEYTPPFSLG